MTDADMTTAISAVYGATIPSTLNDRRSTITGESYSRIAVWGDTQYSAVLSRSLYGTGFRLVVTATRLEKLAQLADVEAVRLDDREAPQRAVERLKKDQLDALAAQAKARVINKAAFRP